MALESGNGRSRGKCPLTSNGTVQGPSRNHPGTVQGPFRDRPGTVQGPSRDRPGTVQEPSRDRPGTVQGPSRDRPGTVQGPYKVRPGPVQGPSSAQSSFKADFKIFLQFVQTSSKTARIMLPCTSNLSDGYTVLYSLWLELEDQL
jgi:hypothetical protein